MALWIILTVMCSLAVMLVTVPLVRRYENYRDTASAGTSIFTDQLREIERDRSLGVIGEKEADLAKIEIERRLIAAAKNVTEPRPISPAWRTVALVSAVGFVVLGSVNIYALRGSPDKIGPPAATAAQEPAPEAPAASAPTTAEVDAMIGKLAERLEQSPGDADGWRMLGWSYFNTQRYEESAAAYGKAMAIDPANLDYKAGHAEALVQAAQGMVTPRAQELFAEVLKADPKELRARFYTALAREQAGEFSAALDGWLSLLAEAPADAGWVPDVKDRIAGLAKKTGRDVSAALASAPTPQAPAAGGLASSEQQATVEGMIAKLAARLDANPRDRDGWVMMIRSLKVKGDPEGAAAALKQATEIFADDPATAAEITELARSLGVTAGNVKSAGE
jgi:cytochrome c-type biogenesis protein CcmH